MTALYLDKSRLEKQLRTNEALIPKSEKLKNDIHLYKKKKADYTLALENLYLDKVRGIISEEDYLSFSKDFSEKSQQLISRIDDMQAQQDELQRAMQAEWGENRSSLLYAAPDHLNRRIIDKMIDYISVSRRIPGTYTIPIEIHWNF